MHFFVWLAANINTNVLAAEEKDQKYMVFEGLSDEESGSAHEGSVVEAFDDDGISHR
jgi:hypothetical protein